MPEHGCVDLGAGTRAEVEEGCVTMTPSLEGLTCLVTGGGRGIGRAGALALARAGAAVAVAARTADQVESVVREIRNEGGRAIAISADVTVAGQVAAMVARTVDEFGGLHVLLCNAGGGLTSGRLVDSAPDEWERTIALNLTSVFHCAQAAIPPMSAQGMGKIVVVGSGTGHVASAGGSAYAAAKAAAAHLVRVLAQEVWRHGIDVNEIVPGPVATDLTRDDFRLGEVPALSKAERVKHPDEVAELIVWLAGRPAQGPTGQTFSLARRPL
ncbi:SDR family NAD(P)-dependent oxidoreductase [Rhodococcus sp. NPDC127530]|uniref:SDR family NAD(P)-dependent oxidoreductase n=1 Tax=unclassified Rhodococcus (in: high G+C Gram-positive bacteria) TaxID=192944 RepID=UPI00363690C5